ncbi:transcriptional regulator [Bacillus sp. AFS076308]|uniref:ROK family transcriptional regulator n=1 Tax=unclassified Bacillus (in: firmicutes) TaxID=185979 RepID=UPI000BF3C74A|nr:MULTISPECIES: ROK family transcriptional regulator [unclassified Bacillus (in: firmicutes)]PFO09323.1 transcriptional regulator [Bacillus sp. AFS076308]PGV50301.1 transcriptional regulator [Bacillus sp. AFS037270]
MRRTGDLKLMQELNRSIILDTIRKHGPISRSDIAKLINISPTTVTSAVNELIHEGVVREDGIGTSNGGRKPVLLRFDPNTRYVIGVSISNSFIKISEMNLEGSILRKEIHSTNYQQGEEIISLTLQIIEHFLQSKENLEGCEGVSIITPGIVDAGKGIVSYNTKLKLYDVPLKEMVEQQFGLPTYLDNDTNAFVLAENYFGSFGQYKDLVYITIGDGVGSGIMVNGKIIRGYKGSSGELGHTTIVKGGLKCECGNEGCLENYVNWPAIYSKIVTALMSRGKETIIKDLVGEDLNRITPEIFVRALNEGDSLCLQIMDEIVSHLSSGIINTIHLLNPEVIILSGEIVQENDLFVNLLKNYVSKQVIPILREEVNIQPTSLGADFEMLGAAAVILQEKYQFTI